MTPRASLTVTNYGVQVNISDYTAPGRNITVYAKTIQCGEDMLSRVSCIRQSHACRHRARPVVLVRITVSVCLTLHRALRGSRLAG